MTKRIIASILVTLLLIAAVFAFAACEPSTPEYDFSGVTFTGKTVTYNGEAQSLAVSGTLPEGVSVTYEGNGKTDAGTYTVIAKFYDGETYITGKDLTATLVIERASLADAMAGITFEDITVDYDGKEHSIAVGGTLPEGVTVTYEGNGAVEVGVHTVTAKFALDEKNYLPIGDMTATITINEVDTPPVIPELSGITMTDKTVTYNGEAQSLAVSGTLPEGVTVTYEGNGQTAAGEYTVVAKLYYNGSYIEGADLSATLTIEKAKVSLDGITLSDKTVAYNGEEQSIEIVGTLPEGVTVTYEGNGKENAGAYTVKAKFAAANDNYVIEGTAELSATLTIEKATCTLDGISFESKVVVYDGNAHSIEIEGALPDGVTVTYEGNGKTEIGEYTVVAKFFVVNGNYVILGVSEKSATLSIEPAPDDTPDIPDLSGITFDGLTVTYDGNVHSLAVSGTLPEGITVSYSGNDQVNAGKYSVLAKFYYNGTYIYGATMSATLTINKVNCSISDIAFDDKTVTYNGEAQSIEITGTLPEGVGVTYEGNGQTSAGTYTVKAKFAVTSDNYVIVGADELNATLVIEKVKLSLEGVTLTDKTVTYNGEKKSIEIAGTLPEGVAVTYEGNGQTSAGTYTVKAKFAVTNDNYVIDGAAELSAKLVIEKAKLSLEGVTLTDKTVTYNGKEQSIEIVGTLPEGVGVTYEGNGQTSAGTYTVKAKFAVSDSNYVIDGAAELSAKLVIEKAKLSLEGITLTDKTVTYNGKEQSIEITGTLPEGVTVTYEGNGQVNAGTYTIVAKFAVTNDNYVIDGTTELSATLVIEAEVPTIPDLSGITFQNKTLSYNGDAQSIFVEGTLPEGITVTYQGNEQTAVGEYAVAAKFYHNGTYIEGADLAATLTIEKAKIEVSVGNTAVTYTFDGTPKSPDTVTLKSTLTGVKMTVKGANKTLPGIYRVVYSFAIDASVADNIVPHEDIEVTMTISNSTTGTDGIVFTENYDGTYHVSGYTGTSSVVIIPSTYNGKAVTAIASRAFENNKKITYVGVPDSVSAIGQSALRGCTSIEAVTLPFVGGSADSSKKYLGYIFGASEYVGNELYVPESLKTVVLSDACTLIPAYSFQGCKNITEIVIGSGVVEIGSSAFRGCTSLKGIYIPENVTLIQSAANNYNSPFFELASDFVIYLGADAVPAGFASKWNVLDSEGNTAKVELGKTQTDFTFDVLSDTVG